MLWHKKKELFSCPKGRFWLSLTSQIIGKSRRRTSFTKNSRNIAFFGHPAATTRRLPLLVPCLVAQTIYQRSGSIGCGGDGGSLEARY